MDTLTADSRQQNPSERIRRLFRGGSRQEQSHKLASARTIPGMYPRLLSLSALLLCLGSYLLPCPAQADDGLTRARARGELLLATDATYPPFEYMENDKVVGFDADLAAEISKEIGMPVRMVSMGWDGVLASVATGKCDAVMSGMTITDERKKGNTFTRPYFLSGQVIARRKGDTSITKPDDLLRASLPVAVQQETTGQFAVEKRGMPKDRIHRFDTLPDALLDVRNGNASAAVGDLPALVDLIRKNYGELEIVPGPPFVSENLGIATRKDSRDLAYAINRALERIMADGRYARIYRHWMHVDLPLADLARLEAVKNAGTPIPSDIAAVVDRALGSNPTNVAQSEAPSATGSALAVRPDILKAAFPQLLNGAKMTLLLTLCTLALGTPLGLLLALGRLAPLAPLRWACSVYVEAVRGTPLLMQIYVIYFVLPALHINLPPFAAGLAALTLNSGAYVCEIFRAGIESIDVGQREAARALGLTGGQAMRFVVLPQTLRRVMPPLTNEAVALLKDSSLVSVVALSELMRVGREIATNAGSPTTVYLAVALLYLCMTLPLTLLVRYLETRWNIGGRA